MSFDTLKKTAGRELFTIVEFDLDSCANTFGVAPCTATGAVGTECYNTWKTCKDQANFVKTTKTYSFVYDQPAIPRDRNFFPALKDVKITSARITPSEGLGARATVHVTLQDFSDTDSYTDKYFKTRTYKPIDQGTFFGKLLARTPFYQNRFLRVKTGYLTNPFDTTNFRTRLYRIDKIVGPDSSGKVVITGRDLLYTSQNFMAPKANKGKIIGALTVSDVSGFTIDEDGASFPATSGTVRVGREIIQYATRSGNVFTTLVRGTNGTIAENHSVNAGVQNCLVYTNLNVVDVLIDLLQTYSDIASTYIPTADWNAEKNLWLQQFMLSTVISKPTKVSKLISELTEQCLLDIWFDDIEQQIKLKAFAPPQVNTPVNVLGDADIVQNSISVEDMPDKRLTQISFYYGMINFAEELTEEKNFENIFLKIDTDAESANEFGDIKPRSIFSRWITASNSSLAIQTAGRLLSRFSKTPTRIMFKIDMKDSAFGTGDFASLTVSKIQADNGSSLTHDIQIIEAQELEEGHLLQLTALNSGFDNKYAFIGPATLLNFTAESDTNKRKYVFISDASGKMSDGSPGYLIL